MEHSAATFAICLGLFFTASLRADEPPANGAGAVTLQILHASDLEGGVDAVADAPNFAAMVEALEGDTQRFDDTILLSAGDNYLLGPFFGAAGDIQIQDALRATYPHLPHLREGVGRVDITIMNLLGFDATAVGNHEFDPGTSVFAEVIGNRVSGNPPEIQWLGVQFPYLSANLDFSPEAKLNELFTRDIRPASSYRSDLNDIASLATAKKLAPATFLDVNNGNGGKHRIGIVGATTPRVREISSTGDVKVIGSEADDMPALAAVLNPVIQDLIANHGVQTIVLVSHLQNIQLELELAQHLDEVDVIIAGGSDTILSNKNEHLRDGDVAAGEYPLLKTNRQGEPVAVVSTDGHYSYVGRLILDFDPATGDLIASSLDRTVSDAYATDAKGVERVREQLGLEGDAFATGTRATAVKQLVEQVRTIVDAKDRVLVGKTCVFLEGRRHVVRNQETNLGNLTADANLAAARAKDASVALSLKNGGGIRDSIGYIDQDGRYQPPAANPATGKPSGTISRLDIENALRFNNGLTLLTLSAEHLRRVFEYSVADLDSAGRFPQVSGVKLVYDPREPAIQLDAAGSIVPGQQGSRVRELVLVDAKSQVIERIVQDGRVLGDPNRPIRMVTLSYLTTGGDGYPIQHYTQKPAAKLRVLPDDEQEQNVFAAYLQARFPPDGDTAFAASEQPADKDQRVVNLLIPRETD
jgi:alkaline phosphatase